MNDYELTYLIAKTSKGGVNQINHINQIQKIIEEKGGTIILTKEGENSLLSPQRQRINLAYPIKKNRSADIVTVEFSVDPIEIKEIVEKIRLNKDILRHILIKQTAVSTRKKIRRERKGVKIESKEVDLQDLKKKEISNGADKTDVFISDDKEKKDIGDTEILKTKKTKRIKKEKIKFEEIEEKLDEML